MWREQVNLGLIPIKFVVQIWRKGFFRGIVGEGVERFAEPTGA